MLKFIHLIGLVPESVIQSIEYPALGWTYNLERFMEIDQTVQLRVHIHDKVVRLIARILGMVIGCIVSCFTSYLYAVGVVPGIVAIVVAGLALYCVRLAFKAHTAYEDAIGTATLPKK